MHSVLMKHVWNVCDALSLIMHVLHIWRKVDIYSDEQYWKASEFRNYLLVSSKNWFLSLNKLHFEWRSSNSHNKRVSILEGFVNFIIFHHTRESNSSYGSDGVHFKPQGSQKSIYANIRFLDAEWRPEG